MEANIKELVKRAKSKEKDYVNITFGRTKIRS